MSCIRTVREPPRSGQAVVVKVACLQRPVGIVGSQGDDLRHRVAIAVAIGIDDFRKLLAPWSGEKCFDSPRRVVGELFRHLPEAVDLQLQMLTQRQHIDDHRHDPLNAVINSRREPGGPAPLAGTGHDEFFDGCIPMLVGLYRCRRHCLDSRLHHRQKQRPCRISGLRKFDERVSDQAVFAEVTEHRLKRNLPHHRDRQSRSIGNCCNHSHSFCRQGD